MNILELRKIILATLLAFAAVMMLPACSSTEEAPPPEESSSDDCDCAEGDFNCMDRCTQPGKL
mgnify:CR=1 FL=1